MSEDNGSGVDKPRIEAAVREILLAIGEDPDRDGLQDTPARVARAYEEFSRVCTPTPPMCWARPSILPIPRWCW